MEVRTPDLLFTKQLLYQLRLRRRIGSPIIEKAPPFVKVDPSPDPDYNSTISSRGGRYTGPVV